MCISEEKMISFIFLFYYCVIFFWSYWEYKRASKRKHTISTRIEFLNHLNFFNRQIYLQLFSFILFCLPVTGVSLDFYFKLESDKRSFCEEVSYDFKRGQESYLILAYCNLILGGYLTYKAVIVIKLNGCKFPGTIGQD